MTPATPRTLFEKVWDAHVVHDFGDGQHLLYIDCHLVNEVTSPQAFEALRAAGRHVRAPHRTIAVADHNVPTDGREGGVAAIMDSDSRIQVETLERNVREFGVPYIPLTDRLQGIVHIIGPELGVTQPGMTIVCGDSHTSTHGAFGALAFGIGTSEAEHVLAAQTLLQRRPRTMLIEVAGPLAAGVSAKDLALFIIQRIGTGGATGHVIEFGGETVRALDMAARMTLCNMAVEMGARAGMIAPDATTEAWLEGRLYAPDGVHLEAARQRWADLASDAGARFDATHRFSADHVVPMVTWGTSPEAVIGIMDRIPDPAATCGAAPILDYMGLAGDRAIAGLAIDMVFIGSCTNGRLEDLQQAAAVAAGRKVAPGVRALVVPGSGTVKAQAEALGLDRIFLEAGFEWRAPGCSMCLGMNPDMLQPGQRCASTSNRNFEGRQGPGGRTHLVSPAMAAAAAVHGALVDVRKLLP